MRNGVTRCAVHTASSAASTGHVWATPRRAPTFYPDAVTLDEDATGERILEIVDSATPGCSVKDSFARLDLSSAGFRILFVAEWIHRAPSHTVPSRRSSIRWQRLRNDGALLAWEAAWRGDRLVTPLFKPTLLENASIQILGGYLGDRIVAGAILNWSKQAIGVSNLFTTSGDVGEAWPGLLDAANRAFPSIPIVGYLAGPELAAALAHGFTSIGTLRVWIR
jgi:hypothetical protein